MAANKYFDWSVSLYRFIKRDTARAEEVNSALDDISNGFTAVETKTNASLKLPDGETATPFAVAATRKGKLVSFNATTGAVETTITAADVSPVAAIAAEVMAVSGIASNVTTVAGISGNVTTVATNTDNVGTVAGISENVTAVAGIAGNVTTVAGITANIAAVVADEVDIGVVSTSIAGVNAVASINAAVNTVAGNNAAVSTCANNIAAIIAAPDYAAALHGTSTTSLAIGTGAKTFTTQTGKQFAAGQYVIAVSDANAANYMFGAVTGYAGTSLEINVISIGGSGTFADWTINLSGARGAAGADSVLTGLTAGKAQQVDQAVSATIRAATTDFTGQSLEGTLSNSGVAIKAFHGVAGITYKRKCLGAGDITAGAGLTILQGGASITTAAGDTFEVYMLTDTTCEVRNYVRATFKSSAGLFYKVDSATPTFDKTGAGTLSIKAGTSIDVAGTTVTFAAATAITMPALVAGTDYAIWLKDDATIQATADFVSAPSAGNWRKIGGFHYGLVAAGTTVAGGSFATTGNGMIWTQADVDKIAGINAWSLWDLKFRPAASDPRGMVLVDGEVWVDIYLASTDTDTNGTSKYNTNIASGTVLPKIPTAFGGNGTTTYPSLNWWVANELARAKQKRLMFEEEAATAFFGVTENQSIDATASTYPTTQRNAGYTSKYGIEQASGHHWIWGQDSNFYREAASPAGSWKQVNGNTGAAGSQRGETYTFGTYGLARVLLGGARAHGAFSGSRASNWSVYPWNSHWSIGLRAACDHLQSV